MPTNSEIEHGRPYLAPLKKGENASFIGIQFESVPPSQNSIYPCHFRTLSPSVEVYMADSGVNWFQWWTEGLLLAVVGLVGLVGNMFSMVIFARQRIQRVFHHLLLLLAIFDAVSR